MLVRVFRACVASSMIAMSVVSADAYSSEPRNDRAIAAAALLDEGRALMAKGTDEAYSRACPKIEESVKLFEGLGNTFHLAQCYELIHRFASAWYYFGRAATHASRAGNAEAIEQCEQRRANVEPKLGRIEIVVPEANRVEGLRVRRGNIDVGSPLWSGSGVPVDKGTVVVEVSAPGYLTWTRTATVDDGVSTRVDVPALTKVPESVGVFVKKHDDAQPPSPKPKPLEPMRTLAWIAGGSALAGLGVGIAGLAVREGIVSRYGNDIQCLGTLNAADPQSCKDLVSQGSGMHTMATIGFIASGVFAATSAVLFIASSPRKQEAHTSLSCGPLLTGAQCALRF